MVENNPWKINEEELRDKAERYNKYYNNEIDDEGFNFSWVLNHDKDKLKLNQKNQKKRGTCDKSVDWGIPNQVIGNPEEANLFLCLLNPRTRNSGEAEKDSEELKIIDNYNETVNKYGSRYSKTLYSYIHTENEENELNGKNNRKEYFEDIDEYIKHCFNKKENVLEQEIADLKKDTAWKKQLEDYKRAKNELKTQKSNKSKKDKKEEEKEIESKYPKLTKYYYLHKFYNNILRKEDEDERDVFERLISSNENHKYNVCNLELFPYRTNDKGGISFSNIPKKEKNKGKYENRSKYSYVDLTTSRFVADLILDRIYFPKKNLKRPIFIFRSYREWKPVIQYELNRNKKYLDKNYEHVEEYFYEFNGENALVTKKSIHKVLKDSEYEKVIDGLN